MHIVRDYFGHRIEALFCSDFEKFKTCRINKKMCRSVKLAALGIAFTSRFPFPGSFSEGAGQAACELEFHTGSVGNWSVSSVCGCLSLSLPVPSFSGWGPGDVCHKHVSSYGVREGG